MRTTWWRVWVAVGVSVSGGCSGFALDEAVPPSDSDGADSAPDADDSADTDVDLGQIYWFLDGTVTLAGGVPVVAEGETAATLSARWVSEGFDGCVGAAIVEGGWTPVERAQLAAWQLTLRLEGQACTLHGPSSVVLAIGAPEPLLAPAADRASLSLATSQGLYLDLGAGELAVGIAGTDAQLDGAATTVSEAPLPDGIYTLRTLYGIPWELP